MACIAGALDRAIVTGFLVYIRAAEGPALVGRGEAEVPLHRARF